MVRGGSPFHRHSRCSIFLRTEKTQGTKPGVACHFSFCEATPGFSRSLYPDAANVGNQDVSA